MKWTRQEDGHYEREGTVVGNSLVYISIDGTPIIGPARRAVGAIDIIEKAIATKHALASEYILIPVNQKTASESEPQAIRTGSGSNTSSTGDEHTTVSNGNEPLAVSGALTENLTPHKRGRPRRGTIQIDVKELKQLKDTGTPASELAQKFGVSVVTIYNYLRKKGG